jgi:probable F420-dependent oxidoreductase
MAERVEIGLFLSHANDLLGRDLSGLAGVAGAIDAAGIDYVSVADHVVLGPDLGGHPSDRGSLGYPVDEPYPDPLITLTAVAAATVRVRLMTGILVAPLRPAPVLAKMAATVDALSGGRLDLGVGTGWLPAEFAAVGVPMDGRVARLEDTVRACQMLWRHERATFASATVSFTDVCCSPRPVRGDIPVWFAGRPIPATLARVATLGAGWLPLQPMPPDQAESAAGRLRRACEAVGRDPSTVRIRMPLVVPRDASGHIDVAATTAAIRSAGEAGVTGVHIALMSLGASLAEVTGVLGDLVSRREN